MWVIPAAVMLTLASIVAMTTLQLQDRVTASYNAQVELGQVQRALDSLQSVPYDVVGSAGPAADARGGAAWGAEVQLASTRASPACCRGGDGADLDPVVGC